MCCWPFIDITLEDAPPPKPKPEEEKAEYVLVSDQLTLRPGVSQTSRLSFHSLLYSTLPFHPNFYTHHIPLRTSIVPSAILSSLDRYTTFHPSHHTLLSLLGSSIANAMSFYYCYVPRCDPEPPKAKAEEAKPVNPWDASPASPASAVSHILFLITVQADSLTSTPRATRSSITPPPRSPSR
jgi:hypothetical protein